MKYTMHAKRSKAKDPLKDLNFDATSGGVLKDAAIEGGMFLEHLYTPGAAKPNTTAIVTFINQGLPVSEIAQFTEALGISAATLARKIGLSKATFHRRQREGRLSAEESDKTIRFARLFGKAVETLEGKDAARAWLSSPQVGLGGAIPLDYAETEIGAREVENLLNRIEYGVYA